MSREAASWISQQVWSFLLDGRVVVTLVGQESSTKGLSRRPDISSIECQSHAAQVSADREILPFQYCRLSHPWLHSSVGFGHDLGCDQTRKPGQTWGRKLASNPLRLPNEDSYKTNSNSFGCLHRWIGIWQMAILWRAVCWLYQELPLQRGYQCKLLRLFVVANWFSLTHPASKAFRIQNLARRTRITCIRRLLTLEAADADPWVLPKSSLPVGIERIHFRPGQWSSSASPSTTLEC